MGAETSIRAAAKAATGSRASHRAQSPLVSTEGFDPAQWRPALIAFCEGDELRQRAAMLRLGKPLDYLDHRMIAALQAAREVMP